MAGKIFGEESMAKMAGGEAVKYLLSLPKFDP